MLYIHKRKGLDMAKVERFVFNDIAGRYCIIMSGEGINDSRMIRERLNLSRIKWIDSGDFCLELDNPTITQALSAKQLCKELNSRKPRAF